MPGSRPGSVRRRPFDRSRWARAVASGGTQIQPSRAVSTEQPAGSRQLVAGVEEAGVGADDGVEGVVALHALLAPHPGREAQPRHPLQDAQAGVRLLLVGLGQLQQRQRRLGIDLDGVFVEAEAARQRAQQVVGPRRERAHALAQRLARDHRSPLAQVHLGDPLGVGRHRRLAPPVIAGRLQRAAAQPAHLDHRRVDAAVLAGADLFRAAQAGGQGQRRVDAQERALGTGRPAPR